MTRRAARARLPARHSLALGLLQGPTELLPVSSSAHTTLVPFLLGWPYAELDGELRKSFEVALHAGAACALAIDMRRELVEALHEIDGRGLATIALSLAPAAATGLVFGPIIERRLGGPASIAAGLVAGAGAMAAAELRSEAGRRGHADARPADGLALGIAQALALIPGVSRYGATLAAGRARGFARADAQRLSWHAALPVMLGASALKALHGSRRPPPGAGAAPLATGAAAAFASTLISSRLLRRRAGALRSLVPYSLYRLALAALAVARMRAQ